jgi:adenylylsulfate kinase-like enzyme
MEKIKNTNLFWFTGQAGAGKTVLANILKEKLESTFKESGILRKVIVIDGDDIRALYSNNDYSLDGRKNNVDFVQKLCVFLANNDIIPIVCMVSPFALQRRFFCEEMNGIEIFVHCNEIRGREHFHVDYYEMPQIDNKVSYSIDTTGKTTEQSFIELWKIIS